MPSHSVATMPALMLKRSSRVIPGLRGTPAQRHSNASGRAGCAACIGGGGVLSGHDHQHTPPRLGASIEAVCAFVGCTLRPWCMARRRGMATERILVPADSIQGTLGVHCTAQQVWRLLLVQSLMPSHSHRCICCSHCTDQHQRQVSSPSSSNRCSSRSHLQE
jgi:hypothetical protein